MIQYYSIKYKHTSGLQNSETRKATVEIISKQLEYVTKGLIAMDAMLF